MGVASALFGGYSGWLGSKRVRSCLPPVICCDVVVVIVCAFLALNFDTPLFLTLPLRSLGLDPGQGDSSELQSLLVSLVRHERDDRGIGR
jgi:hypothetical protein